ncbi:MAG: hypothetical protein WCM93_15790 [Bacteroidota bacterium]
MKNKNLSNSEAISELGMLTAAELKLQKMQIVVDDPLAPFQHRILYWNGSFNKLADIVDIPVILTPHSGHIDPPNRIMVFKNTKA